MKKQALLLCVAVLVPVGGCGLQEIRNKSKVGPEFRHRGSNRTEAVRWTVQEGIEFKWDKGITTALTYRRRDVDQGSGDHDDGIWFDVGLPIWKAPQKPDPLARRLEVLERRLAEVERMLREAKEDPDAGT